MTAWPTTLEFVVPGPAVGKQRPRVVRRGGRTWAFTPKATKLFERKVWLHAMSAVQSAEAWPLNEQYRVTVLFVGTRADVDNALKSVLDGMQGATYDNDWQVIATWAEKRTRKQGGEPRTEVRVEIIQSVNGVF